MLESIIDLKDLEPFEPFVIVFTSGDKFVIDAGANLVEMGDRFFYAVRGGDDWAWIRFNQIVAVQGHLPKRCCRDERPLELTIDAHRSSTLLDCVDSGHSTDRRGLGCYRIVFFGGLLLVWMDARRARKDAIRGFDVKLPTGGTPVLLKKEDNHG